MVILVNVVVKASRNLSKVEWILGYLASKIWVLGHLDGMRWVLRHLGN